MIRGDETHAQPFLKWAGGKSQLLDQYEPYFPKEPMRGYYEPFVGSGAVFFHLRGRTLFQTHYLSEINVELLNCYRTVRDRVEDLLRILAEHKAHHSHDHYYFVRNRDRDSMWGTPRRRAGRAHDLSQQNLL
jgi:DNA adenine methylase